MRVMFITFFLLITNLSSAQIAIPVSQEDVLKLVIFDNGSKQIATPAGTVVSISDWYLSTVISEGNQDLNPNGTLYSRISDASCKKNKSKVICEVTSVGQEFVLKEGSDDDFCLGADYGEKIKVSFDITGSSLTFSDGAITLSMSGDGICGAEW